MLFGNGSHANESHANEDLPPEKEPSWLKSISAQVDTISRQVNTIATTSIPSLEKSVTEIYKTLDDIRISAENEKANVKKLDTKVANIEAENLMLKKELNDTKARMLYLESQSR